MSRASAAPAARLVSFLRARDDVVDPEEENSGFDGSLVHLQLDGQRFVDAQGFRVFNLEAEKTRLKAVCDLQTSLLNSLRKWCVLRSNGNQA